MTEKRDPANEEEDIQAVYFAVTMEDTYIDALHVSYNYCEIIRVLTAFPLGGNSHGSGWSRQSAVLVRYRVTSLVGSPGHQSRGQDRSLLGGSGHPGYCVNRLSHARAAGGVSSPHSALCHSTGPGHFNRAGHIAMQRL